MIELKETKDYLLVFTDDKKNNKIIDELLSALRPGFEFEPRYQSGASDGKTRFYEMQKYKSG